MVAISPSPSMLMPTAQAPDMIASEGWSSKVTMSAHAPFMPVVEDASVVPVVVVSPVVVVVSPVVVVDTSVVDTSVVAVTFVVDVGPPVVGASLVPELLVPSQTQGS